MLMEFNSWTDCRWRAKAPSWRLWLPNGASWHTPEWVYGRFSWGWQVSNCWICSKDCSCKHHWANSDRSYEVCQIQERTSCYFSKWFLQNNQGIHCLPLEEESKMGSEGGLAVNPPWHSDVHHPKCGAKEDNFEGKKVHAILIIKVGHINLTWYVKFSTAVSTRAALTLWYRSVRPNESTADWRYDPNTGIWSVLLVSPPNSCLKLILCHEATDCPHAHVWFLNSW